MDDAKLTADNYRDVRGQVALLAQDLVRAGAPGNCRYALAYLADDALDAAHRDYGVAGVRDNVLRAYINMMSWRGEAARAWKRKLKIWTGVR